MKKKISKISLLLVICLIVTTSLSLYFIFEKVSERNVRERNIKVLNEERKEITRKDFKFETMYVLFKDSNNLDYTGEKGLSYLGILDKDAKIEKLFYLDKNYSIISYNQEKERIQLYTRNEVLYFGENILETKESKETKLYENYSYKLSFEGKNAVVSSLLDTRLLENEEPYPYIGTGITINMDGINNLIPCGVVNTNVTLRYPPVEN